MLTKKESPKSDLKNKASKTPSHDELQEQHYTLAKAPTQQPATPYASSTHSSPDYAEYYPNLERKAHQKTRVSVKYDVGYNNQLYIRGKGANLNWEKGQPLKNVKANEWIWETETPFSHCEFKVLINDRYYEQGENHPIHCGSSITYTPHF